MKSFIYTLFLACVFSFLCHDESPLKQQSNYFYLSIVSVEPNKGDMSTVAMYYFQGDLGESQEYPNAFVVSLTSKQFLFSAIHCKP